MAQLLATLCQQQVPYLYMGNSTRSELHTPKIKHDQVIAEPTTYHNLNLSPLGAKEIM